MRGTRLVAFTPDIGGDTRTGKYKLLATLGYRLPETTLFTFRVAFYSYSQSWIQNLKAFHRALPDPNAGAFL